uniref:Protein asteroid 1 n=1 Tax=Aceria tosichella TaxID=561515 RepID=A0A6G1SHT9_9ACAR
MGVRGLKTFLKINKNLLTTAVNLSQTSLVIDAYILLWLNENDQSRTNGDLVLYGQYIREFFEQLELCQIKPVLVFGEPINNDAAPANEPVPPTPPTSASNSSHFSGRDRSDELMEPTEIYKKSIRASTLKLIFKNVANEVGVKSIHAPYNRIAQVANELNCPVLSNDADFFIYDLKQGFIWIDLFEYKKPVPGSNPNEPHSIKCSIFTHARLARALPGINRETMAVLGILLDNERIDTFARVMQTIRTKSRGQEPFLAYSFQQRQIAFLLNWMKGKSLQQCIDYILGMVRQADMAQLEQFVEFCRRKYNSVDQAPSADAFGRRLEQIYPNDNRVEPRLVELGQTPVQFLRKLFEQNELNSVGHDIIFRSTNEADHIKPSSSSKYIESRPYSLALVLLRRSVSDRRAFNFCDRVHNEPTTAEQLDHLENFGPLDHLDCYSMITMAPELKKKMLLACFHSDQDKLSLMTDTVARVLAGPYVQEAALCFMLVNYIAVETEQSTRPEFLDALMMTIFYYAAGSGYINKANLPNEAAVDAMRLTLEPHSRFDNGIGYDNSDKAGDRLIARFMKQLQCAYRTYCLINPLLDHAFYSPRMERFLNSTLVFRLTKLFHLRELTIPNLCADLTTLIDVCDSLQAQVQCTKA